MIFFFFFKQKPAYELLISDWSSDVCSSDLLTFADLFFPLFLFAIGVSLTLSSRSADLSHVLKRAAKLLVIGIALATLKHERFALTGVLQHIAVAYVLAWAILRAPRRWHVPLAAGLRSAEHTSELQTLMRTAYAVF